MALHFPPPTTLMKATNPSDKQPSEANPTSKQHPVELATRSDGARLQPRQTRDKFGNFCFKWQIKNGKEEKSKQAEKRCSNAASASFNCEKSHDLLQCGTARLRVASGSAAAAATGGWQVAGGRWHLPFECCRSVARFRYIKEATVNGIDDNTWAPYWRLKLSLTAATAFQLQVDVASAKEFWCAASSGSSSRQKL